MTRLAMPGLWPPPSPDGPLFSFTKCFLRSNPKPVTVASEGGTLKVASPSAGSVAYHPCLLNCPAAASSLSTGLGTFPEVTLGAASRTPDAASSHTAHPACTPCTPYTPVLSQLSAVCSFLVWGLFPWLLLPGLWPLESLRKGYCSSCSQSHSTVDDM